MERTLFIGLVTHPRSRFTSARGPGGLAARLTTSLSEHHWNITSRIEDENRVGAPDIDLSLSSVQASVNLEFETERAWLRFQRRGHLPLLLKFSLSGRKTLRRWNYTRSARQPTAKAMLLRLANIEEAHIALMKQAVTSGCAWTLILEDDAQNSDVDQLARDLARSLEEWDGGGKPSYVNMSASFPLKDLKLSQRLTKKTSWDSGSDVLSAPIPFTNTVCAMLYRHGFLENLLSQLQSIPLEPVIPIDWKMNKAIMELYQEGKIGPGDCYSLDPAPIIQGSMHGTMPSTLDS